MKLFPSDRDRQQSNRRTVSAFFAVIAFVMLAYIVIVAVHRVLVGQ